MQVCDILFAVVLMVTLSFYYRFVKLSLALLAAVALLKTCVHILFWNDRMISDNFVTSTNLTFDILVCLIFLFFSFLLFSSFWYYSLPVLENDQETSLIRRTRHISDLFSSSMRRQPAVQRCAIRIWHNVEWSRVSRTQCCKHLDLQSVM